MKPSTETSSLATEAYTTIRRRIVRGELIPGQAISRRKLAAELGMSFLPVSEALLLLEFEGLLESRPRAGTRVRIPTQEEVEGHYVVREALEVQAAMLFAKVATESERTELRKLAKRVDTLSMRSNRMPYLLQHQKLHRRIAECTRCAVLCDAIESSHALASIWIGIMRQASQEDAYRHQDFVERLVTGTPEEAAQAVRDHLAVALERSLQILQPYFRLRKLRGKTFFRGERGSKTSGQIPS